MLKSFHEYFIYQIKVTFSEYHACKKRWLVRKYMYNADCVHEYERRDLNTMFL